MMDTNPAGTKPVRVMCPKTSATFKVRVNNDTDWLAQYWQQQMRVRCPRCGQEHGYRIIHATLGRQGLRRPAAQKIAALFLIRKAVVHAARMEEARGFGRPVQRLNCLGAGV